MDEELYRHCKELSDKYDGVNSFWEQIARETGYSPEALRSQFRRERERRGDNSPVYKDKVSIKIFDIETLLPEAMIFGTRKQHISPDQLLNDWSMLGWAVTDLASGNVRSQILTSSEAKNRDDARIVSGLWEEINSANILIGHNINGFDIPHFNTRAIYWGMEPPAPYRTVDTLDILRRNFAFTWNKLGWVCHQLGLREKVENDGIPFWQACARGDVGALKDMNFYNEKDVLADMDLYMLIRSWDNKHPNVSGFFENKYSACKICDSTRLEKIEKPYQTNCGMWQQVRCKECGAVGRIGENLLTKEFRKAMVR